MLPATLHRWGKSDKGGKQFSWERIRHYVFFNNSITEIF